MHKTSKPMGVVWAAVVWAAVVWSAVVWSAVAAILPLTISTALAQSPLRARADNGREVILRADGTWAYADGPAAPPAAAPPAAVAQPAPQSSPQIASPQIAAPRTAAPPPSVPPSASIPSVRSLLTPPAAAPGTATAPPAPTTRPPAPAPTAAPTVSPGAGVPPAVAQPAPPVQTVPPAQPASQVRPAGLPPAIQRPRTATATLDTRRGNFRIWYNPANWQPAPENAEGRVEFRQPGGQGVVVVIPEGSPLPLVALRTAAVENARRSGPDARIVAEQTRRIGTRDVLLLQINATLTAGNQPVTYLGHYYGDPKGSIQVVGAVGQRDLERLRPAIQELLDGLDLNRQ